MDGSDPALLQAEFRARLENARSAYDEAVWLLLLGRPDDGLAAIRRNLPDVLAAEPASAIAAQLALVSGDTDATERAAAAAVRDAVPRYVAGYRDYLGAVLSLAAADEDTARAHQARLDAYAATHDKLGSHPSGVAQIPRGLLQRDAALVTAGIEALLGWHLRRARARSEIFNSSNAVVSLEAVVALMLAHRRGLSVPVAPAYRSASVPLLVIHLTEWHDRPLPRAFPLDVVTDLVAGPWLRANGVDVGDPPAAPAPASRRPGSRTATRRPPPTSSADEAAVRAAVERRLRGAAHPWQLAGWALMLGDVEAARGHLRRAAADARRRWQETVPQPGGALRWFRKDQALPNQNYVREEFALALVLGDEAGISETTAQLQAWLRTQEGRVANVYAHATGYLDLICDLLGGGGRPRPSPAIVAGVNGPHPSTRVAAMGLVERDPGLLREGLDAILGDLARELERKTSPPPPVSEQAIHLATAARRLGVPVTVDDRYAAWPVPVEGGRLPADLLGRALWGGQG